jgi:CRISPR-associated endoribonuclease Cas6
MRCNVTFSIEPGSSLSPNYPFQLAGLIYRLFSEKSSSFSKILHDNGLANFEGRPFKYFTFSQLRGGVGTTCFREGCLVFHTDVLNWRFGSPLEEVASLLADALLAAPELRIGTLTARVEELKQEPEPDFSEGYQAVALSPIVASVYHETMGHRYLDPRTEEFWAVLAVNGRRKWEALKGSPPEGPLTFRPDMDYLKNHRTSKRLVYKDREPIVGHLLPFRASGPVELLRFLHDTGFGSRNSFGFGMTDSVRLK